MADRLFGGFRHHSFRHGVWPRQHLCQGVEPGEAAMSTGIVTAHSVVEPSGRAKTVAATLVIAYAVISMIPLVWIVLTGFKTPPDSISYPPKVIFEPTLEGSCHLFTTHWRQAAEHVGTFAPR